MNDLFPPDPECYRLLVDHTEAFALFLIDLDGVVRTWNPGAERVFGWPADAIIGQPAAVLWTPEDLASGADVNETETAMLAGDAPDIRAHLRRDGTRVWVEGVMTAVRDRDGRLVAYVKAARDATVRHTAETLQRDEVLALRRALDAERAEVRRLTDALSEAVVGEQRRIAGILHDDLQQLLVGATMHVKVLKAVWGAEDGTAHVERLAGVLDAAVATTRTLTSRLVPPDVLTEPLPESLRWLATHFADAHGLYVRIDADNVDGPADPVEGHLRLVLFQAARELLFNVVKHAETTEAKVSVRSTPRILTLVVADRGVGISTGGVEAGYGLADIRQRVATADGTLTIRPAPGGGTQVVARVPRSGPGAANPYQAGTQAGVRDSLS